MPRQDESYLRQLAMLTPDEVARGNAYDRTPENIAELRDEIARTKRPADRAVLEAELAKLTGSASDAIPARRAPALVSADDPFASYDAMHGGGKSATPARAVLSAEPFAAYDSKYGSINPPKSPGILEHIADTGLQLAQGVVQGGKMLADTFGAGNQASNTFKAGVDWLAANFSDQLKWEQLTSAQEMKAAELSGSTWEEVKAASRAFGRDPVGYLVNAAGTSIPTIAAAFIPGGQGAMLGRIAAMGLAGAAQGAGSVKGQIYEEVEKAWQERGVPADEAKARASAAQEYLGSNAGQIALGTALGVVAGGGIPGLGGVESAIASKMAGTAAGKASTSMIPRFVREGVKEAIPEGLQGGQERLASNLALQNEGFDQSTWGGVAGGATLEAMAGGIVGAAASPLTKPLAERAAGRIAAQDANTTPDDGMRQIVKAKSVNEMIVGAQKAMDVPLTGIAAEQENRAMDDLAGLRKFGGITDENTREQNDAAVDRLFEHQSLIERFVGKEPQPAPSAEIIDAPWGDRVLTLQEHMADPSVRDAIRSRFGGDALATVAHYAGIVDRTDLGDRMPPEKTRERMLATAERIVSESILRPIDRPGAASPASSQAPGIGANAPVKQIGLDAAPTGAIRVDSLGNAAPAMRADAINTAQANQPRERGDGLTQQVDRTPLARDDRDFTMVGEGQATTATMPVRQPAEVRALPAPNDGERAQVSPAVLPGDLTTRDGMPYGTKSAATVRAGKEGGEVVEIPGAGWVVRKQTNDDGRADGSGLVDEGGSAGNADVVSGQQPSPSADGAAGPLVVDAAQRDGAGRTGPAGGVDALTVGASFNLDGKSWTITQATPKAVTAKDDAGNSKMIAVGSKTWARIAANAAQPGAGNENEQQAQRGQQEGRGDGVAEEGKGGRGQARGREGQVGINEPGPTQDGARVLSGSFPASKLEQLVEASGRPREDVAAQYTKLVEQHGREKAGQMLDSAIVAARQRPVPKPVQTAKAEAAVDENTGDSPGLNNASKELRAKSHMDERPGDVMLASGGGAWVSFDDALASARAAAESGELRPDAPFQFNRALDIAPRDWDRMASAMKNPAPAEQAAEPAQKTAESELVEAQPAATHKDPGEPAEPVTPAVVAEAIKTGVQATERKPSAMKADLLRMIAEAIPRATHEGRKQVPRSVEARDDPAHYIRFKVPGDGTFTVMNATDALTEFRASVESSPGFSNTGQRGGPPKQSAPKGSSGPEQAIRNMIDGGDPQAAVDYAAARGIDVAEVLKSDKVRRPKVAGLMPTKMGAIGEFEPEATKVRATPDSATPSAAEKAALGKIDDFGEKLEGARKDFAAKMRDAMAVDVRTATLAEAWPEPNYAKLIEGGADAFAVGWARASRDEIPTKPQVPWKLTQWVKNVTLLREISQDMLSGGVNTQDFNAKVAGDYAVLRDKVGGRAELYEALGHDQSLKGIEVSSGSYSMRGGVIYNPAKTLWTVERKAKGGAFGNWPRELAMADTRQGAIAQFIDKMKGGEKLATDGKGTQFVIWRESGKYHVGKKIGKDYASLKKFDDVAAARRYKAENQAGLEAALARYKDTPFERRTENLPRVGEDHRGGARVTPEVFDSTFGFRGIQFGNYVEQGKRQSDLNDAYDALMDLAAVIGVQPRALSLGGQLGLAFGARGKGGINAAAAHYEPGTVVINLTKDSGAGSLAHELLHAIDNYFAKLGGGKGGMMTMSASNPAVRPEMVEAFKRVTAATQQPGMKARSRKLDKRRSKAYWSTSDEMAARSFEAYVIAKLHDQGAANDYLANIVSPEVWDASEALLGHGDEKTYPYPTKEEMGPIREAFDGFFDAVQTRTDDAGNVALFSRSATQEKEESTPVEAEMSDEEARALLAMPEKFDGKMITQQVLLSDTGKTATMRMDAGRALRDLNERESTLAKLKACIGR